MYEYSHGGNVAFESGREASIDLSANMNPLGMPIGVPQAIMQAIPQSEYYPDSASTLLRAKIAEFEQVDPAHILCGNGASDLIFRLPRATNAQKVMVCAPSFSDYQRAAIAGGAQIIHYPLMPQQGLTLDDGIIAAVLAHKPQLVFICNPNNPTGLLTPPALIQRLLQACQSINATLAVDECFLDFTTQRQAYTSKQFLPTHQNLVIIKAFTKIFALPGIRLGYVLTANRALINSLNFHGTDWAVSNLAQAAGIAALHGAHAYIEQSVDYVTKARTRLAHKLNTLGYTVFPSQANYLFLQNPYPINLRTALDTQSIRIRACANYPGLNNTYYRIAVPKAIDEKTVFTALDHVSKSQDHSLA